ncbi:MAG: U32 family peptidase [Candidatus Lokiarchaeota archaeon]|nr:U32 family peptidase [Candidatus Lokiarchaeota archaeon]MBD3199689.1 U32 family peptidase [Candidatus Lokiarchaeota archaeon]
MKKVELLAPARDFKAIKAAAPYADSIYFGIKKYNMRMRSENISLEKLPEIIDFCKKRKLRTYLTTNVLVYDQEIDEIRDNIQQAKELGIDAVIVHDIAIMEIARSLKLPFHVSTQCNVSNSLSARFYEKLGAQRIILARELSLEKIKEIKRNLISAEIETFIHGAMCASVSGRCYFSQDICGTEEKSANRGSCIQPCRRRWWVKDQSGNEYIYDGVRFMNSRDLCTIAYIPDLIEANIDAFKIEGRMRHPHYVETVSKVYREAIDAYYDDSFSEDKIGWWVTELKRVYNRGFTPGFYFKRATEEDHQHNYPYNLSHYRYIRIGKIFKYNANKDCATVNLNNGYLQKGADLIIMGNKSDTYIHQDLKDIEIKNKKIDITPRGTKKNPIKAKIRLDEEAKAGDTIYVFTNKTYKKGNYNL